MLEDFAATLRASLDKLEEKRKFVTMELNGIRSEITELEMRQDELRAKEAEFTSFLDQSEIDARKLENMIREAATIEILNDPFQRSEILFDPKPRPKPAPASADPDEEQPESLIEAIAAQKGLEVERVVDAEGYVGELQKDGKVRYDDGGTRKPPEPVRPLEEQERHTTERLKPGEFIALVREEIKDKEVFTTTEVRVALGSKTPDTVRVFNRLVELGEIVQLTKGRGAIPGTYTHKWRIDAEKAKKEHDELDRKRAAAKKATPSKKRAPTQSIDVKMSKGPCPKVGHKETDELIRLCYETDGFVVEQRGKRVLATSPDGKTIYFGKPRHDKGSLMKGHKSRLRQMGVTV